MKVGDKIILEARNIKYSSILLRETGYSYHNITFQIEAIFPETLIIWECGTNNIQNIRKELWLKRKKSGRNY